MWGYISNFLVVDGSMANWHFSSILHFGLHFKSQSKYGLMGSRAKTGKFFIRGSLEWKRCTFLGPKHKSAIWGRTPPHLHIKPSLYVCRKVQGSQIFKQNWIISISSRVIVILKIQVSSALGGGAGGWGMSGVISYSLYEFRNVQR